MSKISVVLLIMAALFGGAVMSKVNSSETVETATFAGGCFWCMEPPFENLKAEGVISVESGYAGGRKKDPTYEEVSSGTTGHAEAVQVTFDPAKISYERLLDVFWRNIDPTDPKGQFADQGSQYRTAIFYHGEAQRLAAEKSKDSLARSGKFEAPIVTQIAPAGDFYRAEDYHQNFYKKNPQRYKSYKVGSGREGFLKRHWGKE